MSKLVINVDDFGLTKGVNQAVFKLVEEKVAFSTTAIVMGDYFLEGMQQASMYPELGIGIHLTLDTFKSLTNPALYTKNSGQFVSYRHIISISNFDYQQVYDEWKAQIDYFIEATNKKPSHIDSHHHIHMLNDTTKKAVLALADEYQLPVRGLSTEKVSSYVCGDFYAENATFSNLCNCVLNLNDAQADIGDIMVHPAFVDDALREKSSYSNYRENELQILISDQFKQFIEKNKIIISKY